jgi:hypothetical protein
MRTQLAATRLCRIVEWRRTRFERLRERVKDNNDRRAARRAADLFTHAYRRLEGAAMGAVPAKRAHDGLQEIARGAK